MGDLLHLIDRVASQEALEAALHLVEEIRAGKVIGFAWVAMHRGHHYSVDIAGETRRSPTFTRGMLHVLDDELSKLIRLP
jgi:hypothetical protein